MKGYKGKVYFYKDIQNDYYGCVTANDDGNFKLGSDYIELVSVEVDVTFGVDTRPAEIDSLERQKTRVAAECQHNLDILEGKIQSLRAIAHDGES